MPAWPRFHGPHGTNLSAETGLLRQWPEGGPRRLWTAQGIGDGFATVAIAGGRIYTAGNRDDKTIITALDLDGKIAVASPQRRSLDRLATRLARHAHDRRRPAVPRKPAGRRRLPGRPDRAEDLGPEHPGEVRRREHHLGPGRVAADRRRPLDLLARRAADGRRGPGQAHRPDRLEIAQRRRRSGRLRVARAGRPPGPADDPDDDLASDHRRERRHRRPAVAIRARHAVGREHLVAHLPRRPRVHQHGPPRRLGDAEGQRPGLRKPRSQKSGDRRTWTTITAA